MLLLITVSMYIHILTAYYYVWAHTCLHIYMFTTLVFQAGCRIVQADYKPEDDLQLEVDHMPSKDQTPAQPKETKKTKQKILELHNLVALQD